MTLAATQQAALELCFGPEPRSEQFALLGDERIWRLYRELVRKRLRSEIKHALPRTVAATGDAAFERAFDSFLNSQPPRTRFFHAVVGSFAASSLASFRSDRSLAPWTGDLCEFEAVRYCVADLADDCVRAAVEFSFDRKAVLSPTVRLLTLNFAVHAAPTSDGGYAAGAYHLCVYRPSTATKASHFVLNPLTHDLMQRLLAGDESVAQAVKAVASQRKVAVDQAFLEGLCSVLADFIERGVIVGGA
jgi:hypothetical protein